MQFPLFLSIFGLFFSLSPLLPARLNLFPFAPRFETFSLCQQRQGIRRSNVGYILNPSGDLLRTEEKLKPLFKSLGNSEWSGVSGHPPGETTFSNMLSQKDLVVYCGHGAGESFLSREKVALLPNCAVTLLMGCSSGKLTKYGEYGVAGAVESFLLAGSPAVIANLWDVTDKGFVFIADCFVL